MSSLAEKLCDHLQSHNDNEQGMFDPVLRRLQSVAGLCTGLSQVDAQKDGILQYLLDARIGSVESEEAKMELLRQAPGIKVRHLVPVYASAHSPLSTHIELQTHSVAMSAESSLMVHVSCKCCRAGCRHS